MSCSVNKYVLLDKLADDVLVTVSLLYTLGRETGFLMDKFHNINDPLVLTCLVEEMLKMEMRD